MDYGYIYKQRDYYTNTYKYICIYVMCVYFYFYCIFRFVDVILMNFVKMAPGGKQPVRCLLTINGTNTIIANYLSLNAFINTTTRPTYTKSNKHLKVI